MENQAQRCSINTKQDFAGNDRKNQAYMGEQTRTSPSGVFQDTSAGDRYSMENVSAYKFTKQIKMS